LAVGIDEYTLFYKFGNGWVIDASMTIPTTLVPECESLLLPLFATQTIVSIGVRFSIKKFMNLYS
jgi:hypothetical protein